MYDFDLFVIGAGSGGVRAARMSAQLGARVGVAEERYMGGTCVNVGCIPKKLYAQAAHYRYDFEDSGGFGWQLAAPQFDWATLRDNKKQEIARLNGIYQGVLDSNGARVLHGKAIIRDAQTVEVDGKPYTSRYLLVATGGWPFVPDFPGSEHVVTSNGIFDLERFPQRILVVGGGYVAVEFAGIFAGLGARTWLSYRGDLPLRGFDREIREFFLKECAKYLNLLLKTDLEGVEKQSDGSLRVSFRNAEPLEVDCVLAATGRKPNLAGLGLENTAVELTPEGNIRVDADYRTSEPSIFALGDVVGRLELTPVALAEGMALADILFGKGQRRVDYANIATAIFSHPNIGTVGLSEEDARKQVGEVDVYKSDFRALKHTLSGRDARTLMKIIVNPADDRVLGIHMVGDEAGEIIQGFSVAMNCGLTKTQLDQTIGIHPTAAEELVTMREKAR